ncbi:hypothetical protein P170DRAFT_471584 [Aspergillus steynii IBT 23096]|uniref:Uncharacterized protein n=1 Tax=Aspergillus steynii IBT 23096 TaxID=1392250 RepID=A0A2I2GFJ7_9EURO|nr:uncharacterized protein P170DRAFT_471584 [Aspergillus steynii IBT 23096]PLB51655.1 hypothetical protein P170DRAFT_471584 [Aspergillus steynii IBT 23096]
MSTMSSRPMCNQDCPGCSNCLSVAPSSSGRRGSYTYYSRTETFFVSSGSPSEIGPTRRSSHGSGDMDDLQDRISNMSMDSPSKIKPRRRSTGASRVLEDIGEDSVVRCESPTQLLLPAPDAPRDGRSTISSSTHRSNRSRRSSRDIDPNDDDDMRTVITLKTIAPSDSVSNVGTRVSKATRRSSHPERDHGSSKVSTRTRDDDESTIRGHRPKDSSSRVSSSRHGDDRSRVASSVANSRTGAASELTSRVGSRAGISEIGSKASTRHRDQDACTMLSSRIQEVDDSVVSHRAPSMTPSRRGCSNDYVSDVTSRRGSQDNYAPSKCSRRGSREEYYAGSTASSHRTSCDKYAPSATSSRHTRDDRSFVTSHSRSSFASLIAVHHDFASRSTLVLALRVSPHDQDLFQQFQERHSRLVGHPLFVLTLLFEISLNENFPYVQKIRRELSAIEKATGQHGWLEIPAVEALAHDSELSRLGHAAEIHVSIFRRRLDFLECYLESIQKTLKDLEEPISRSSSLAVGLKNEHDQWLQNIAVQFKLRQADFTYYQRRVDNQITAIYGLLSQRDNMLGVSVAVESKKILEASKRDGSALKSLTVLATLFFPDTSIATLFTLPHFTRTPLWVY